MRGQRKHQRRKENVNGGYDRASTRPQAKFTTADPWSGGPHNLEAWVDDTKVELSKIEGVPAVVIFDGASMFDSFPTLQQVPMIRRVWPDAVPPYNQQTTRWLTFCEEKIAQTTKVGKAPTAGEDYSALYTQGYQMRIAEHQHSKVWNCIYDRVSGAALKAIKGLGPERAHEAQATLREAFQKDMRQMVISLENAFKRGDPENTGTTAITNSADYEDFFVEFSIRRDQLDDLQRQQGKPLDADGHYYATCEAACRSIIFEHMPSAYKSAFNLMVEVKKNMDPPVDWTYADAKNKMLDEYRERTAKKDKDEGNGPQRTPMYKMICYDCGDDHRAGSTGCPGPDGKDWRAVANGGRKTTGQRPEVTKVCKWFIKGDCRKGKSCNFAHSTKGTGGDGRRKTPTADKATRANGGDGKSNPWGSMSKKQQSKAVRPLFKMFQKEMRDAKSAKRDKSDDSSGSDDGNDSAPPAKKAGRKGDIRWRIGMRPIQITLGGLTVDECNTNYANNSGIVPVHEISSSSATSSSNSTSTTEEYPPTSGTTSSGSDGAPAALDDLSDFDDYFLDNQGEQLAALQRHDERRLEFRRDADIAQRLQELVIAAGSANADHDGGEREERVDDQEDDFFTDSIDLNRDEDAGALCDDLTDEPYHDRYDDGESKDGDDENESLHRCIFGDGTSDGSTDIGSNLEDIGISDYAPTEDRLQTHDIITTRANPDLSGAAPVSPPPSVRSDYEGSLGLPGLGESPTGVAEIRDLSILDDITRTLDDIDADAGLTPAQDTFYAASDSTSQHASVPSSPPIMNYDDDDPTSALVVTITADDNKTFGEDVYGGHTRVVSLITIGEEGEYTSDIEDGEAFDSAFDRNIDMLMREDVDDTCARWGCNKPTVHPPLTTNDGVHGLGYCSPKCMLLSSTSTPKTKYRASMEPRSSGTYRPPRTNSEYARDNRERIGVLRRHAYKMRPIGVVVKQAKARAMRRKKAKMKRQEQDMQATGIAASVLPMFPVTLSIEFTKEGTFFSTGVRPSRRVPRRLASTTQPADDPAVELLKTLDMKMPQATEHASTVKLCPATIKYLKNSDGKTKETLIVPMNPCQMLETKTTVGVDSFAGVSCTCYEGDLLHVRSDGPIITSGTVMEGLAGTVSTPTKEGIMLLLVEDAHTRERHFICDPYACLLPEGKVRVFSASGLAKIGNNLRMGHGGINRHALVNDATGRAINLRTTGNVTSLKVIPFDKRTVRLPQDILRMLQTPLKLYQIIGCAAGVAKRLVGEQEMRRLESTPPIVPVYAAYLRGSLAAGNQQQDFKDLGFQGESALPHRDDLDATMHGRSPTTAPTPRKRPAMKQHQSALSKRKTDTSGQGKRMELPEVSSSDDEPPELDDDNADYHHMKPGIRTVAGVATGNFGQVAVRKMAAERSGGNAIDPYDNSIGGMRLPLFKIMNVGKLNKQELSRLWLARFGQPSLQRLYDMQRKGLATGAAGMTSNLQENNWLQAKGHFRRGAFKRQEEADIHTPKPDEMPWDTIVFDKSGPYKHASVGGATMCYHFRSRIGGNTISRGCITSDQFPWILEDIIINALENGFKPRRTYSDNGGEFLSAKVKLLYRAYEMVQHLHPPQSPQSGGAYEKLVGDVTVLARTNMLQAPHLPPSMWLLATEYANRQMYLMSYSGNPNGESPHQIEKGFPPDWNRWGMKVFGAPVQFRDDGLIRPDGNDSKHDAITIDGWFVGYEGISVRVYQRSLNRVIKVARQKIEFLEADYVQPPVSSQDLAKAWNLDATPSALPSVTGLTQAAAGEEWDAEERPATIDNDTVLSNKGHGHEETVEEPESNSEESDTNDIDERDIDIATAQVQHVAEQNGAGTIDEAEARAIATDHLENKKSASDKDTEKDQTPSPGKAVLDTEGMPNAEFTVSERRIYTTKKHNETCKSIAAWHQVHWRDIAEQNLFEGVMPFSNQKLKKGTEINLPNRKVSNHIVMKIVTMMATQEPPDTLTDTGDQNNPFNVSEKEARKWKLPKDVYDALMSPMWKKWVEVTRKEMKGFTDNDALWRIKRSECEPNRPIIKAKEIYSLKFRDGWLMRPKFRYAARGDMLTEGLDFGATYWSSASSTTIKLFIAMATEAGIEPNVIDVNTAYLEAQEEFVLYAERPSFADIIDQTDCQIRALRERLMAMSATTRKQWIKDEKEKTRKGDVNVMTRAQYGVPSAGAAWGRKLRDTFLSEGMLQSQVHNALWYRRSTENYDAKTDFLVCCTITDDIPFYGSPIAMQWFEEMMRRNFSIKIEREFTALIGLEINWDKKVGTCEITQRGLINKIAEEFKGHLHGRKRRDTPLPDDAKSIHPDEITDDEFSKVRHLPYASLLCSIGYVAEWSKPELLFARSLLSSNLRRWNSELWGWLLDAAIYMIGHKAFGTIWSMGMDAHGPNVLYGFADASFGGEPKGRSRCARVVKFNGAAILCKTNKSTIVHMSTTASEIDAGNQTGLDIVAIRNLLEELGVWYTNPTVIYEDNQATIQIANNEAALGDANRHMHRRLFKIKELVENKTVLLAFMETQRQVADILTKALGRIAFCRLRDDLTGYTTVNAPGSNIHLTADELKDRLTTMNKNCTSKTTKECTKSTTTCAK